MTYLSLDLLPLHLSDWIIDGAKQAVDLNIYTFDQLART